VVLKAPGLALGFARLFRFLPHESRSNLEREF